MQNNLQTGSTPSFRYDIGTTLHKEVKEAWEQSIEVQGLIQAAELVAYHTDGTTRGRGALIAVLNAAERLAKELNIQLDRIEDVAKQAQAYGRPQSIGDAEPKAGE